MHRRMFSSFALLVMVVSLGLLACDLATLTGGSKPTIVIASPPSGSQFREGEDVSIQSNAVDTAGITRVELLVDGTVVRSDPAPSPQLSYPLVQIWKATQGTHTLSVRAYNTSNKPSEPAAILITVAANAGGTPGATTTGATSTPTTVPTGGAALASPTATSVPGACTNGAAFVADVTVADGTVLAPGQPFNKIWRVRNSGTCAWGAGYQFVFIAGEAMSATTVLAVPATAPGATADLLIAMAAPVPTGAHTGQWKMRGADGALFGGTLNVTINVSAGATPTNTPPASCPGGPVINSFSAAPSTITAGGSTTLSWGTVDNANAAFIDQGVGGIATPGNIVVTPGSTTTYTLTATGCGGTTTRQVTVTVNPASGSIPAAPALGSPSDGKVFRVYPRIASFSWGAVAFSGGVTYSIEIQKNTGSWSAHVTQTSIAGTSYVMTPFVGDNPGRWRVWATSPTAGDGTKSDWRYFSFSTGASQYSGTWVNDDSGTGGVTHIVISNTGQTLNVHPYGKCLPSDCDWGVKSQAFSTEPFVIGGFPSGGSHQLTITLNNDAGTQLKAVDSGSAGTATFHK